MFKGPGGMGDMMGLMKQAQNEKRHEEIKKKFLKQILQLLMMITAYLWQLMEIT